MILSKLVPKQNGLQGTLFRRWVSLYPQRPEHQSAPGWKDPLVKSAEHANPKLWKNLTLFVCIPAIILAMINAYLAEKEHWGHYKRRPFVPYEYMYVRRKPFPWGDGNHSLFHNPLTNALPDGWEPLEPELAAKYDPPDIIISPTALAKLEAQKAAKGE